jgi:hypothetical protein
MQITDIIFSVDPLSNPREETKRLIKWVNECPLVVDPPAQFTETEILDQGLYSKDIKILVTFTNMPPTLIKKESNA